MITLTLGLALLVAGYFVYGRLAERAFGVDPRRATPAVRLYDGVDYTPMPLWRVFMIQFLNIAGLGPIFGAILGAMYGPMAYLWIVLGCVLMGGCHDFFAGMLSVREEGRSLPDLVGKYLGGGMRWALSAFTMVLLVAVGVAFVSGPAKLLQALAGGELLYWILGIFGYYILATVLPVNKIIGRIYPVFGAALLFMAVGVAAALYANGLSGELAIRELSLADFRNFHADSARNPLFPMLFVVISCGAISGFHATQSTMMARCLRNERQARPAFYGAMAAEGIVALIWATVAINYFGGPEQLNATLTSKIPGGDTLADPAWIVNTVCTNWLGTLGAALAIIGVVACPITSGDTAFRSARLIVADFLRIGQKKMSSRLAVTLPLFAAGFALTFGLKDEFATLWQFVGISNQFLAVLVLWTASMYFAAHGKRHWMASIPATFLTVVCVSYLMIAPHKSGGLALPATAGHIAGAAAGAASLALFLRTARRRYHNKNTGDGNNPQESTN